jgi:hypothetical protein
MTKAKGIKTTLYLDEVTWKALRVQAIEEGVSATRIVEQLIRDYLERGKGGRA